MLGAAGGGGRTRLGVLSLVEEHVGVLELGLLGGEVGAVVRSRHLLTAEALISQVLEVPRGDVLVVEQIPLAAARSPLLDVRIVVTSLRRALCSKHQHTPWSTSTVSPQTTGWPIGT
jgi:hypothetical protein